MDREIADNTIMGSLKLNDLIERGQKNMIKQASQSGFRET